MNNRHIVIGDVHGCLTELQSLISRLSVTKNDVIIFVGDLIDRGPKCAEVVKYARELSRCSEVVLVEGNHEEKYRRWRKHREKNPEIINQMTGISEFSELHSRLTITDKEWLDAALSYYKIPGTPYIVVHAGIPPNLHVLPSHNLQLNRSCSSSRNVTLMQRVRAVAPDGRVVPFGEETNIDVFWATTYDGRFGEVIFGHSVFLGENQPVKFPHAIGLDLGVVYGGYLVAAIISNHGLQYAVEPALDEYSSAKALKIK